MAAIVSVRVLDKNRKEEICQRYLCPSIYVIPIPKSITV